MMMRMMSGEMQENPVKYVKVKLFNENPVLTDVLLDLVDSLPEYKERANSSKGRKKPIKDISNFSLDNAAAKLSAISDPKLLIVIPYGLAIGRELPVSIKRLNYCLLYGRIREIST